MTQLDADYDAKQHDLDHLQGEVSRLESVVESISASVRDRTHILDASSVASLASPGSSPSERDSARRSAPVAPTPLFGSPANRLAASAANAAAVARQLAEEEERQFAHSLRVLNQSPASAAVAAAARSSPYSTERSADVQRALQSQLDQLESEMQNIRLKGF